MSVLGWIDSLPRGWEAKPLRSTVDYVVSNVDKVPADDEIPVRLCNYTDVYNNEFITLALEFMQATATKEEIAKFGLRVDDVAITKDSESWDDIGVPALVRETASDLVCGYHLALLRPHKTAMDGPFLFRCLQAKPVRVQLELAANGVTRFGIPKSEIGAMTLPVPPLVWQRAIADYLDRETARLDALVAAKERVLGLLAEKRRALIARAVTRGLDPRAPLRDSGIPWIGEIPAHWEMVPFRWYFRIRSGDFMPSDDVAAEADPVRRTQVIGGNGLAGYAERSNVEGVTVVIGRVGALCGNVHLVHGSAWITDNALLLTSVRSFVPAYLAYVLREFNLNSLANKTAQPLITGSMVADLRGPLPPREEQCSIVEHIAHAGAKLAAVSAATERTIALLKERRAALIAAAVTGQLEVA